MSSTDCLKPLLGIKGANKHDVFPQSLKESNKLYAKGWKQGFFAITGEKPREMPDYKRSFKLMDPFLAVLVQYTLQDDEGGHLGFPDLVNPIYWFTLLVAPGLFYLFCMASHGVSNAFDLVSKGFCAFFAVVFGALLVASMLPALLTTYIWDLAKVITAAVTVTVSSALWYPIKLAMLKHNEKGDDYEDTAHLSEMTTSRSSDIDVSVPSLESPLLQ